MNCARPVQLNFGRHSADYAAFRPGFPASFYDRLGRLVPLNALRCLDLATGPGVLAQQLSARGSIVTGIDLSTEQLRSATGDHETNRGPWYAVAQAESIPVRARSVDLVTAGHCWHWFDHGAVLQEVHRVLVPGGYFVIAYYSYLAHQSEVVRETERLILQRNPSWQMAGSSGVFPGQVDQIIAGGFEFVEAFFYDHTEAFSHERWRGRMRTCNGVGSADLPSDAVRAFDRDLAGVLGASFPEPLRIPHRVWCVVGREPGKKGTQ